MAKGLGSFRWEFALVQDGMIYYRRVVPKALREAHNLPRIVKKATGLKDPRTSEGREAAKAIAVITKLNAEQEREWSQLEKGITGTASLNKVLAMLRDHRYGELSDPKFEVTDLETRDYLVALHEKGKLPPELALLMQVKDFRDPKSIPTVLSVALADYLQRHKNPSDGLRYDSTSSINRFIKLHGDIAIKDITRAMVHDYVKNRLDEGIKTTTLRRELNQLSAIINKAYLELELEKKSPFTSIDIPSEGKDAKKKNPITPTKLEQLLAVIRPSNTTSHLIAKILLNTGMRISELAVSKVSDVYLVDNKGSPLAIPFISVVENNYRTLKNQGSERNIPLVGVSLEAIREAVKQAGKDEYLFQQYAKKAGGTNASSAVNAALDFVDINSHEFRHYLATRMREAMIPVDVRETITGHCSKGSSEFKGYGEGYKLEQLHPVLMKIAIN